MCPVCIGSETKKIKQSSTGPTTSRAPEAARCLTGTPTNRGSAEVIDEYTGLFSDEARNDIEQDVIGLEQLHLTIWSINSTISTACFTR